jgi:hypothetical protein
MYVIVLAEEEGKGTHLEQDEMAVYKGHAYETVVYGRGTPMRWPMREARL